MWKMIMIVKWNINIRLGNGVLAIIYIIGYHHTLYKENEKKGEKEMAWGHFYMPKIN